MNADAATITAPACYHCGLPVLCGERYTLTIAGENHSLCCPACKAVAETIVAGGFANYYRYRAENSAQPADNTDFSAFDQPELQQQWLKPLDNGTVEAELLIEGMHCAACVWLLENYLLRQPGIDSAHVNLNEQRAQIVFAPAQQKLSAICRTITDIGYRPQPYTSDRVDLLRRDENKRALRHLGVAGIGMMQVGMCAIGLYAGAIEGIEPIYRDFLRWISLLVSIPIVAYAGQSFFIGAWRGLRMRRPGMDVPIVLAIVLGFTASTFATVRGTGDVYFDSVTMFIFLLLGSRYLELRARHYSGRLSNDLLTLLPQTVTRLDSDGAAQTIPLTQLLSGDTLLVSSGHYVPADGVLLDAHASINEAALTGEFMPVHKQRGDHLLAGSVNGEQPFTMRAETVGTQTRLSAIHHLSRQASAQKPRLAQLADRIASIFVTAILLISAATYAFWYWYDASRAFWITLAVLVVSCPCALGLATPVAITNATNTLRRLGLLVTKADVWEKLPAITDIVFDKTGTLSAGRVRIVECVPCGARSPDVCRDIANALEIGSAHPIARAFINEPTITTAQQTPIAAQPIPAAAQPTIVPAQNRQQIGGAGVEGWIAGRCYRLGAANFVLALSNTQAAPPTITGQWILLGDNTGALCWFRLDDSPRAEAAATVTALQQRGFTLHLLSGDRSDTVDNLAKSLRIEHALAGASPEQKLEYIERLQRDQRHVLMVGDGINDIPVLAAADVSVAMSNASQLAKTSADCIFLGGDLARLLTLFGIATKTRRIIRENLLWALLYNLVAIPLAALGWVSPYIAAIGMSLSSLLVVGNALRLHRFKPTAVIHD